MNQPTTNTDEHGSAAPGVVAGEYGVVTRAVPEPALRWANGAVEDLIERELKGLATSVAVSGEGTRRRVIGFTGVTGRLGAVALYLMGLPAVVALARRLCGGTVVPSHDWVVIKNPGDGRTIEWHQDFTHERRFPAISVGIHLDDARADALRVIPGTQRVRQDLCEIRSRVGYDSPEAKALGVPAGSLVWHDAMLVHGSPALPGSAPRRKTYYIEFRPEEALREHAGFPAEYIDARKNLFAAAEGLNRRLGEAPRGDVFEVLDDGERAAIAAAGAVAARIDLAHYCTPLPA